MKRILLTAALIVAMPASAGSAWHTATVTRTLVQEGAFGNCMALVSPGLAATGLNCPSGWVSFSCSGDFNSKEVGNQKMEAAQLALVTGYSVRLKLNDAKKHNTYCYAERIDNLAN